MHKATKCIVCGNAGYYINRAGHERVPDRLWNTYKCSGCRMEFCQPMPNSAQLNSFYNGYSDPWATKEVLIENGRRDFSRLKKYGISKASCLLDFGCGQGIFTQLGGKNWKKFDPYCCFEPKVLRSGTYDCVTLWGVLEHVTDPVRVLTTINQYLRAGGFVFFTTVGTETHIPYRHKPPEHLTYWTEQAIAIALKKAGFRLMTCEPYTMTQKRDLYMDAVLRTVPMHLKRHINYAGLPEMVRSIPTNEVFVAGKKSGSL